ncbi:probable pectate lyase 12, partial [Tanacetum coccineum]
ALAAKTNGNDVTGMQSINSIYDLRELNRVFESQTIFADLRAQIVSPWGAPMILTVKGPFYSAYMNNGCGLMGMAANGYDETGCALSDKLSKLSIDTFDRNICLLDLVEIKFGFVLMSTLEEDEKAVDAYNGYVKVIIGFNHFGEQLLQRMAECRRGCIHVVNDVYLQWEMYAIGKSGNPTINSPGDQRGEGKSTTTAFGAHIKFQLQWHLKAADETGKEGKSNAVINDNEHFLKKVAVVADEVGIHRKASTKSKALSTTSAAEQTEREMSYVWNPLPLRRFFKDDEKESLQTDATLGKIVILRLSATLHSSQVEALHQLANGLIQRALALHRQAQALNRKAKALHLLSPPMSSSGMTYARACYYLLGNSLPVMSLFWKAWTALLASVYAVSHLGGSCDSCLGVQSVGLAAEEYSIR